MGTLFALESARHPKNNQRGGSIGEVQKGISFDNTIVLDPKSDRYRSILLSATVRVIGNPCVLYCVDAIQ
jgi:hypothetical protein